MTPDEVVAFVKQLSFDPGSSFTAVAGRFEVYIKLTRVVQDSNGSSKLIKVELTKMFDTQLLAMADEHKLARIVFETLIMHSQEHEAMEWFRVGGQRFLEPHP